MKNLFHPKSLVLGAAIGLLAGVFIAPSLNLAVLNLDENQTIIPSPVTETIIPKNGSLSLSDKQIVEAIFQHRSWDYHTQGQGASIANRHCDTSISTMHCDLELSLPWAKDTYSLDVALGLQNSKWYVKGMRINQ